MKFDLVEDPWIPVVTAAGPELMSLRRCLVEADQILGLGVDAPLETVAVFRQVLLPVYLDAVFAAEGSRLPRTPTEWAELWHAGVLDRWPSWAASSGEDTPVAAYLERYRDRFQAFGERPFAQVGGLRTAGDKTKPVSVLIASAASGNNVPLFSARTEADPPALSAAEAIRAVLATQCWDTAAIKSGAADDPQVKAGKTTGNPTGPLGGLGVVLPLGGTLAQTLLVHVPMWAGFAKGDRPQWRAEEDRADGPVWRSRPPRGLLDLLTWQSRRIRLVPEPGSDGDLVVRRVVLTAGDRLADYRVPLDVEPHTAAQLSKARKVQVPVRHSAGQAAWRGMLPMLTTDPTSVRGSTSWVLRQVGELQAWDVIGASYPLRVLTVGVQYGNQSAVVEDVIADMIPLPVAALKTRSDGGGEDGDSPYQALEDMVRQAEELRQAANGLGNDLRLAAGGAKLPWDKGQNVGDRMVHEFTPPARRVLSGLQRNPEATEKARAAWTSTAGWIALDTADRVLNAVPPEAFLGRKEKDRPFRRAAVAEAYYRAAVRKILGLRPGPQSEG